MSITELVTDPYNRRARLQPALMTVLPIAIVPIIIFPGLEIKVSSVLGIIAWAGGTTWLTQVGRERGKQLEQSLFDRWGGAPSMSLLRHSDHTINNKTKARYHAFLTNRVPVLSIPSRENETKDPVAADELYASATDWLLTQTRDKQAFRLVFEENMNYGFRRNLWAMRPFAFAIDIIVAAGVLWLNISTAPETNSVVLALDNTDLVALSALGLHFILFLAATEKWVHTTALAFAKQLVSSCDTLGTSK